MVGCLNDETKTISSEEPLSSETSDHPKANGNSLKMAIKVHIFVEFPLHDTTNTTTPTTATPTITKTTTTTTTTKKT